MIREGQLQSPERATAGWISPPKPARALIQSQCACGGSSGVTGECETCRSRKLLGKPLQPKPAMSEPGDMHEQEADRVAEQVMRMPEPGRGRMSHGRLLHPLVQRRTEGDRSGVLEAPPSMHDVLDKPGHPLDAATRAFFEPRLGHDFSQVRVHADERAEQSARDVNAHAYTVGHDIVFGSRRYAPETVEGRRLLAHELVHVAQQRSSSTGPIIQRRLIATGGKADVNAMLGLLESASGLTLKHGAKGVVSITGLADKNPSFELATRLQKIIDDPKQDAEIHLGRKQAGVLFGAFPSDPAKLVQEIRIDHMLALEKGAPGSGVAKLAHEIIENYEAHALTDYNWSVAFDASHDKAKRVEDLVEGELGHPGAGRNMFAVYPKAVKGKDGFNRWIEDREQYFLVWEQDSKKGTLSNARRVPRVKVSTYTIDGFTAGSDTLPKEAEATIAALTTDMKNNPTASALVKGFANVGSSDEDKARLAEEWTEMVQDKVIELTGDVIVTNWRRFHRMGIPALIRNSVVITLDRPDL